MYDSASFQIASPGGTISLTKSSSSPGEALSGIIQIPTLGVPSMIVPLWAGRRGTERTPRRVWTTCSQRNRGSEFASNTKPSAVLPGVFTSAPIPLIRAPTLRLGSAVNVTPKPSRRNMASATYWSSNPSTINSWEDRRRGRGPIDSSHLDPLIRDDLYLVRGVFNCANSGIGTLYANERRRLSLARCCSGKSGYTIPWVVATIWTSFTLAAAKIRPEIVLHTMPFSASSIRSRPPLALASATMTPNKPSLVTKLFRGTGRGWEANLRAALRLADEGRLRSSQCVLVAQDEGKGLDYSVFFLGQGDAVPGTGQIPVCKHSGPQHLANDPPTSGLRSR